MNRTAPFALALLLSFAGIPAWAQAPDDGSAPAQDSGQDGEAPMAATALRDVCAPPASADAKAKDVAAQICKAYLSGLADGMFMLGALEQQGARICLPDDGPVSPEEAKSEFQDYIADHPEAVEHSAGVAASFGMVAAHPCE